MLQTLGIAYFQSTRMPSPTVKRDALYKAKVSKKIYFYFCLKWRGSAQALVQFQALSGLKYNH